MLLKCLEGSCQDFSKAGELWELDQWEQTWQSKRTEPSFCFVVVVVMDGVGGKFSSLLYFSGVNIKSICSSSELTPTCWQEWWVVPGGQHRVHIGLLDYLKYWFSHWWVNEFIILLEFLLCSRHCAWLGESYKSELLECDGKGCDMLWPVVYCSLFERRHK